MKLRPFGVALAACVLLSATAARADYSANGNGQLITFGSFDVVVGAVTIRYPGHVFMGLSGGVPMGVTMTTPGALDVRVVAGGAGGGAVTGVSGAFVDCWNVTLGCQNATAWDGSAASATQMGVDKYAALKTEATRAILAAALQDTRPASSTITAADAATSTVAGQGGVTLVTGTPTANSFQTQAINYASSANIITTGTFVATMQLEGSPDGGVTYVPISGLLRGASLTTATITGPGVVSAEVAGFTHVRVRASAYTSGTATVKMTFSAAAGPVKILNGVKQVDSGGSDATDIVNHAVKVNVVAGGAGGGAVTVADNADVAQGAKADLCTVYTNACSVVGRLAALEKAAEDTITASPISAASLPLPSGASTSAIQSETHGTVAAGTAANKSELTGCVFNTSLPTLTTTQQAANQCDSSGRQLTSDTQAQTKLDTLHTDMGTAIPAGTNLIGKVGTDQTTHGTTDQVAADITKIAGTATVTGGVAGSLGVGGTAAANATTTGNPVKVGCVFSTATTAATTGQLQFEACDAFGNTGRSITPSMATQITASSANVANASAAATLAAAAGKTTYISGFACTASGATAASVVTVTVAGVITGTMNYTFAFPAGATAQATPLIVTFPNPVAGSAVNTAIVVTLPAGGAGNTNATCNAQGLQQ